MCDKFMNFKHIPEQSAMPSQNFGFPYSSPYPTQLELLRDVYDAIDQRKIGFFESPTGTVKLSVSCLYFIV